MSKINGSFLIFIEDLYEDLEVWYPKLRLAEAGAKVVLAAPEAGRIYHGKHSYPALSDAAIADLSERDFSGVILAGGFSPDKLRRIEKVKQLTREFMASGKLVAHICHGGWMAASAGICRGFRMTSTVGIKDDLENAGAVWVDEPVVVDRNMVSSRNPGDLPDFMKGIFEVLG
ncbi:MAG: type 1 glutamine amidotransferase [Treponema sp.]|nr:type 1 glutamine amidotransferase [Treponema sp.]MCL2127670.1 type 1 glutamine amidotransferase [Treponema sp.]